MPFKSTEKKEIESMIKKEIKDFFDSNNSKQFEKKLFDKISTDLKRGELKKDVKDIIIKSFQEYFIVMYQQRSFWEQKFRGI
jgi:retron-type reverse transcriptase